MLDLYLFEEGVSLRERGVLGQRGQKRSGVVLVHTNGYGRLVQRDLVDLQTTMAELVVVDIPDRKRRYMERHAGDDRVRRNRVLAEIEVVGAESDVRNDCRTAEQMKIDMSYRGLRSGHVDQRLGDLPFYDFRGNNICCQKKSDYQHYEGSNDP